MKTYDHARNYLDSFVNYEKKSFFPYQEVLKLERVKLLFSVLKIPYKNLKAVHIAGTKGKGSTAHFCANILAASGHKVGLYTSPHFFDLRERIQIIRPKTKDQRPKTKKIEARMISCRDVAMIVGGMKPLLEKLRKNKKYGPPSFFEVYTALAFKYFLREECDFVVLETGLGGRLDATNTVAPLVSVITHIGYDHMDKLGDTLPEIAREKAGIIKKNIPVICAPQGRSAGAVIDKRCRALSAPLFILRRDFHVKGPRIASGGTLFDFTFGAFKKRRLKIPLRGRCQVENAGLALAAVCLLRKIGILQEEIDFREGLRDTFLEGRFEEVSKDPRVIVDVAHNLSSFKAVNANLKTYFPGKKVILIFGAAQDKDIKHMLSVIDYDKIILTSFNNPRAFFAGEINDICGLKNAYLTAGFKEAFNLAKRLYNKDSLILVSGSFFLAAEAKKYLEAEKHVLKRG